MKTLITIIALISISPVFAQVEKIDDFSLKSERDGQQNNLNLLNAEIARLEKMIQDTGIKAKPVEATEEKGE